MLCELTGNNFPFCSYASAFAHEYLSCITILLRLVLQHAKVYSLCHLLTAVHANGYLVAFQRYSLAFLIYIKIISDFGNQIVQALVHDN